MLPRPPRAHRPQTLLVAQSHVPCIRGAVTVRGKGPSSRRTTSPSAATPNGCFRRRKLAKAKEKGSLV